MTWETTPPEIQSSGLVYCKVSLLLIYILKQFICVLGCVGKLRSFTLFSILILSSILRLPFSTFCQRRWCDRGPYIFFHSQIQALFKQLGEFSASWHLAAVVNNMFVQRAQMHSKLLFHFITLHQMKSDQPKLCDSILGMTFRKTQTSAAIQNVSPVCE